MGQGQDDGRDEEINALLNIEGIDSAKIAEQITKKGGRKPEDIKPPDNKPPDDKNKPPDNKPPDEKKNVPDPDTILNAKLNETFGERFKTWEDFKKADIPASLQELETLRQTNKDLETRLQAKPKTQFVNEDIAKLNEFIRETGIKDVGIFNRLNEVTDVANMPDMDALILLHVIENPRLARKDPQEVRRYFETKYNVDPAKVEAGDLTKDELEYNKMELEAQADKAKLKLQEFKGKIKVPEPPKEEISEEGKTKWTPEVETKQKALWEEGHKKLSEAFATIGIPIKGGVAPIINFGVSEESRNKVLKNVTDYMRNNQLEVNDANVKAAINMVRTDLILDNFDQIIHAVSEHVRGLKEEEYLKLYHNPSPKKNSDTPGGGGEDVSDEAKRKRAFDAEMDR